MTSRPRILVAAPTDADQVGLLAGTVLPGDETDRRREIAAAPDKLTVAHLHSQNAGGDEADPGDSQQTIAELIVCKLMRDFFLISAVSLSRYS